MTAPLEYAPPTLAAPKSQRNAALALALATVFWGCGFTWAKMGGEAVQRAAGVGPRAPLGPIFFLVWRFTIGGIVWLIAFPEARRGWTLKGLVRAGAVGALLGGALIIQHVGLDRTSEAVSAFLTSLTILFVPLLMLIALRTPPKGVLWVGVIVATAGVWLMTGATPSGFGWGEFFGLACALGFSIYILAVNAASKYETPWRMTAGQFISVGVVCYIACVFCPGGPRNMMPHAMFHILAEPIVWQNLLLMSIFPTIAAFGLLTHFQPRIDPTRAALIYLLEPVVAATYATIAVRHVPGGQVVVGAGLILIANVLVEALSSRKIQVAETVLLE